MASSIRENLALAYDTVRTHKLRSGLTMLGVFIGTVTLMAIGSILTGLNQSVVDELKGFGTDTIFIYKFDPGIHIGRLSREERMRKPLSEEDIDTVRVTCTACENISPEIFSWGDWRHPDDARYKGHEVNNLQFTGATPVLPVVLNRAVAKGRYFTSSENEHRAEVVVLGDTLATALFADEDPIGKDILVNGTTLRVIGVFEKQKSAGGNGQDVVAQTPYLTYKKLYPNAREHFIAAAARPGQMDVAMDQIREALRRSRRVKWNDKDSFGMATADSIIAQFHDITAKIALVIVVLSSIGMMIGGVGVMNIMLVSVTERTREIGIRKAIGARRADITQQFLSEAVFLTGCGGLLGILGGWLISLLLNLALPNLPSSVPLWAVVTGFSVSVSIGVFFGMFPAMKASKLDPVEALRYE